MLLYLSSSSDSSRHPDIPSYNEVLEARDRITPHVHRTPVFTSSYLDQLTGRKLFFKCENFQKTGSFKARGAVNAVSLTIWRQHLRQEGGRCVSCQYALLNWYIYKLQQCMACHLLSHYEHMCWTNITLRNKLQLCVNQNTAFKIAFVKFRPYYSVSNVQDLSMLLCHNYNHTTFRFRFLKISFLCRQVLFSKFYIFGMTRSSDIHVQCHINHACWVVVLCFVLVIYIYIYIYINWLDSQTRDASLTSWRQPFCKMAASMT